MWHKALDLDLFKASSCLGVSGLFIYDIFVIFNFDLNYRSSYLEKYN